MKTVKNNKHKNLVEIFQGTLEDKWNALIDGYFIVNQRLSCPEIIEKFSDEDLESFFESESKNCLLIEVETKPFIALIASTIYSEQLERGITDEESPEFKRRKEKSPSFVNEDLKLHLIHKWNELIFCYNSIKNHLKRENAIKTLNNDDLDLLSDYSHNNFKRAHIIMTESIISLTKMIYNEQKRRSELKITNPKTK